jgi:putative 4-mercaptohistidine N1-methyltranferase
MNRGRETEDGRRKTERQQSLYESDPLVDQYLLFHYGTAEDQLPYSFGPVNALFYPIRCVTEFGAEIGTVERALDLGCAVGRSTFELARIARTVIGIDLSQRFIAAARQIKQTGRVVIRRIEEGEISTAIQRELPKEIDRARCSFAVGDATALPDDLGVFDLVFAANLIDRVGSPKKLLNAFPRLIRSGGHLILASPYTWLEEFTPKAEWIGGKIDRSGRPLQTIDGIRSALESGFSLRRSVDLPFLIREHARKFQWSVAQATLWRRKD